MFGREKLLRQLEGYADEAVKKFLDSGEPYWTVNREKSDPFTPGEMRRAFARVIAPFTNNLVVLAQGDRVYLVRRAYYEAGKFDPSAIRLSEDA